MHTVVRGRNACRCVHHILLKRVVRSASNPSCGDFSYVRTLIFGTIKYTLKDDTLIYDIPGPPPPGSPAIRSRPRQCPTTSYIQKESTRLERNTPHSAEVSFWRPPASVRSRNRPESRLGLGLWTKSRRSVDFGSLSRESSEWTLDSLVRVPLI